MARMSSKTTINPSPVPTSLSTMQPLELDNHPLERIHNVRKDQNQSTSERAPDQVTGKSATSTCVLTSSTAILRPNLMYFPLSMFGNPCNSFEKSSKIATGKELSYKPSSYCNVFTKSGKNSYPTLPRIPLTIWAFTLEPSTT